MADRILIALGGNMPTIQGPPAGTLRAALAMMPAFGIKVVAFAPFYRTPALASYIQPDYVNSVAVVEAADPPRTLLDKLHRLEAHFGRVRRERWGPRPLDLDLLDFRGEILVPTWPTGRDAGVGPLPLALPHPGISGRAFVLLPLRDVAPDWHHPVTGRSVGDLIAALPEGEVRAVRPAES
ncbi:MAG: 2-amino-4-hydroxy-6-hydroxymethyldihydropteridine diphosphokinase [Parvibaculum sp.]|nr:2-amino-4-hydroxy-6-hydroxymethyldihydropteridine diphosphokinase [Parvibaculum sp.]